MADSGWVKLHRKMTDWEWYRHPATAHLFIHLLLCAENEDTSWRNIEIKRGQVLTTVKELCDQTGLSTQQTRTALSNIQNTHEITIKATNKYTVITIENYAKYQLRITDSNKQSNKQITNNPTNKQQTTQQTNNKPTLYKEVKKEEVKNKEYIPPYNPPSALMDLVVVVLDYLNAKCDTNYKVSSKKTQSLIHARVGEGYSEQDFYTVIDKKSAEWFGTEFEKYLRPETLFSTKFEGYLNQHQPPRGSPPPKGGGAASYFGLAAKLAKEDGKFEQDRSGGDDRIPALPVPDDEK
jgi:uncharacterized phage protein (TIGR02220 family)